MDRERAKEIGLHFIDEYIEQYGKDSIYIQAPKPGKNSWTCAEYREALLNDTNLEDGVNPIDDILTLESYYNSQGKSLEDAPEINSIGKT